MIYFMTPKRFASFFYEFVQAKRDFFSFLLYNFKRHKDSGKTAELQVEPTEKTELASRSVDEPLKVEN